MKKIALFAALGAGLYLVAMSAFVIVEGTREDRSCATKTAVVLGNAVHADGTPSARLRARLDAALILYQRRVVDRIIVSGGIDAASHDEAKVMAAYLHKLGVQQSALIQDNSGTTTIASARNARQLIRPEATDSIFVVSQYFHLPRARVAFQSQGFRQVCFAYARFLELRDVYSVARETIALPVYLWKY